MANDRSFTAYVKDKFYNDIYPVIEEYVEQGWGCLDIRLRNVHTVGGIKDDERDATDWMEWQGNSLAPKIQMPFGAFKTKAHEFIKAFQREKNTKEIIDVIEPVIDDLTTFFCVFALLLKYE